MTGENPPDENMSEEERLSYEEARKEGRTFTQKSPLQRFAVILKWCHDEFSSCYPDICPDFWSCMVLLLIVWIRI